MPNLVPYSFTALIDTDTGGDNIIAAQAVSVKFDYDGTLATIYSDAAGTSPIPQPGAVTDSNGVLEFWVEAGRYQIESGSRTEYVVIDDGSMLVINESEVGTSKHLREGDRVTITDRANSLWDVIAATTNNGRDILDGTASGVSLQLDDIDDKYCNPEKYGANITDDQTSLINTLLTQNRNFRSVLINKPYKISSTAPNAAITVNDGEGLVAPKYNYHRVARGDENGYLSHTGTGDGVRIVHSNGTSSPEAVELINIVIHDADGQGGTGLVADGGFAGFVANRLYGACNGWGTSVSAPDGFFYSEMNWDCHNFRTRGAAFGGQINAGAGSGRMDLRISSDETTVVDGLSIGDSAIFGASQRTSSGVDIKASIEIYSGRPAFINLIQGGKLDLYMETPGNFADYDTTAFVFNNMEGVDIAISVSSKLTRGFSIANSRDCKIHGYLEDNVNETGRVDSTCVGIDVSGLAAADIVSGANFVTGRIVGTGSAENTPVREGFGSKGQRPVSGTWGQGSILYYTNAGTGQNIGAIVTASGTEGSVSQTVSGTSGSNLLTVTDTTAFSLGDILNITSIAGDYVVNGFTGSDLILDTVLPSTISGETVSFKAPVYKELFTGVQSGQTGSISASGSTAVVFPVAFPSAPNVVVSHVAGTSRDGPVTVSGITATGCTIYNWSTSSTSATWFANL